MSECVGRISLDFDEPDMQPVLHALEVLGSRRDVSEILVYRSPSRRGFHVIANLKGIMAMEEQLKVREELGDCKTRMEMSRRDGIRGFLFDVLFSHKKVNGKWMGEKLVLRLVL